MKSRRTGLILSFIDHDDLRAQEQLRRRLPHRGFQEPDSGDDLARISRRLAW